MNQKPPAHLSRRSKSLWRELVPRRINYPETMALLISGLESLDAADACRERVAVEGLTLKTLGTGTVHKHPLIDVEKSYRAQFLKAWAALNLTWVPSSAQQALDSLMEVPQ